MKNIVLKKREDILELMLQRSVARKWIEEQLREIPATIMAFNPDEGDKESQEYKDNLFLFNQMNDYKNQLNKMAEADKGDTFAYKALEECYKETIKSLQ